VRDILAKARGETIRLLLLRTHYRSLLDFSDQGLVEAKRELDRFYRALEQAPGDDPGAAPGDISRAAPGDIRRAAPGDIPPQVLEALCDDLNTPLALSAMHVLADAAMTGDRAAASSLRAAGSVLGLLQQAPSAWFKGVSGGLNTSQDEQAAGTAAAAEIEAAIADRLAARKVRDWRRADAIRAELAAKGIQLEDGPKGTTWRRTN
jgi:cysteinyl-tRNA synthetase